VLRKKGEDGHGLAQKLALTDKGVAERKSKNGQRGLVGKGEEET